MIHMRETRDRQGGYTVIELMVALGIFGVLAVISATAMISIYSGIRSVSAQTQLQVDSQNSAQWIDRLIRYTAVPDGQSESILELSPTSMTMNTYSGTGSTNSSPYRARLMLVTKPDGDTSLISDVAPGQLSEGEWFWPGNWQSAEKPANAMRRYLLTVGNTDPDPILIRLWVCNPEVGCSDTLRDATPTELGPVTLGEGEVMRSVEVLVGNTEDPDNAVRQSIELVNLG